MLLKIADQLTKTIGDLAAISGSDVSAILAKLSDIRKTSDNLGSSLQAYVSTSGARMQAEAALAAKKLKTIAANNIMTRSLAVQAVTSNMATSLDMFNMTTHSLATMAAGNEGGLIGVSEMVQNLNSSATVQLQTLLSQVQDGTMSLKTALGIASQLNTADLDSISDIANAFSTIIYQYLALTEQTFADADQVLGDFNASAADTVNAYSSILLDALTPVNDLITLTQTVSGSLDKNFETELADLNGKLGEEQKISGEEVISVADSASFITQLIKNAASDYSEIEKKESEAVAALASWAQINYHGLLSSAAPSAANLLVDSANLAWIE